MTKYPLTIHNEMNDEINKHFIKCRKKIQKLYPGSTTKMADDGNFYIVDKDGYRILRDEFVIPDSDSVCDAWIKTSAMIWNRDIIDRNNRKFNDDKMLNRMLKKIKQRSDKNDLW